MTGVQTCALPILGKRIAVKTGCPLMEREDTEGVRYWTVLYIGRNAEKEQPGSFVWKLREELKAALLQTDLSGVPLYFAAEKARIEQVESGAMKVQSQLPDLPKAENIVSKSLAAQTENNTLITSSEQKTNNIYRILPERLKTEALSLKAPLEQAAANIRIVQDTPVVNEPYTKAAFLSEVYMTEEKYHILVSLLRRKKNLILQGAPGVGKTFAAKRLAYSIMGEKDDTRIAFVQFHQSYSYEDFILGYKPQGEGFALTEGVFYRFCIKAQKHPDKDYFFIIDEINRGNMSKIFGELLMLIEKDYRGSETVLAYGATPFSVPENLYLIGMMNTADRSLAMIDYALRRRFSFFEMEPSFDARGFQAYQESLHNETFNI